MRRFPLRSEELLFILSVGEPRRTVMTENTTVCLMSKYDFVDLSSFSNDASMFEVFSSKNTSMFNSYAADELDAVPTEEEKSYFESLKVRGKLVAV